MIGSYNNKNFKKDLPLFALTISVAVRERADIFALLSGLEYVLGIEYSYFSSLHTTSALCSLARLVGCKLQLNDEFEDFPPISVLGTSGRKPRQ